MTDSSRIRVLVLAKYGTRAASTRQRMMQFKPFLEARGVELELRALLDDRYLDRLAGGFRQSPWNILGSYLRRVKDVVRAGKYDVVWLQYELFPYLPAFTERLLALIDVPVVYDIDDAIFHQYDRHTSQIVRLVLGKKLTPHLRHASACLCGNFYLHKYVASHCESSLIVPTVVDTQSYRSYQSDRPDVTDNVPLVVGWIGSPSTWKFVEPLLPTILPVISRLKMRFRVIGAGPRARGITGIEAVDWSEEREIAEIQGMDIGIMPLPDKDWTRGKCGYKLIQYMACGLPSIASPVGVNTQIIDHGVQGFLADSAEEWATFLQTLAEDQALRNDMGLKGRRKVVASYSLKSQQELILSVLLRAAGYPVEELKFNR